MARLSKETIQTVGQEPAWRHHQTLEDRHSGASPPQFPPCPFCETVPSGQSRLQKFMIQLTLLALEK
jgi:hypothetical protein